MRLLLALFVLCLGASLAEAACSKTNCIHGRCQNNKCICNAGWKGTKCDQENPSDPCAGKTCSGNGRCESATGRCKCNAGWEGTNCNIKTDKCRGVVCQNKGTCVEETGRCKCVDPYYGTKCENNRCAHNCSGHGTCDKKTGRCNCAQGWSGAKCETEDKKCDEQYCVHGKCEPTGKCKCDQGYTGPKCDQQKTDPCLPVNPCKNGGQCKENSAGRYYCECKPTFSGTNCEDKNDKCEPNPCKNGAKCQTTADGKFRCQCLENSGYSGKLCDQAAGACQSLSTNPCKNGGICKNSPGEGPGYKCQCKAGFIGTKCEKQDNPCSPNPCKNNGKCIDNNGNAECECRDPYTGNRCQESPCDASRNPCSNGGKCTVVGTSVRCQCKLGWTGEYCDQGVCSVRNPCQNGGVCVNPPKAGGLVYACICLPYFTGYDCDKTPCDSSPCENGGICTPNWGNPSWNMYISGQPYLCKCPANVGGTRCEVDPCVPNPCENGKCTRTTTNGSPDFKCECEAGFNNRRCTKNVCDPTPNGPCLNEGKCVVVPKEGGDDDFKCECLKGWSGQRCESDVCGEDPTNPVCLNGGECYATDKGPACKCAEGFSGEKCQLSADRDKLLAFKESFANGVDMLYDWNGTDTVRSHCGWKGVTCDAADRVIEIDLKSRSLKGPIKAAAWNNLPGTLQKLNMQDNDLGGSNANCQGIPEDLRMPDSLEELNLSVCRLCGQLPAISRLNPFITNLRLNLNQFEGELPWWDELTSTRVWITGMDGLCGAVPDEPEWWINDQVEGPIQVTELPECWNA